VSRPQGKGFMPGARTPTPDLRSLARLVAFSLSLLVVGACAETSRDLGGGEEPSDSAEILLALEGASPMSAASGDVSAPGNFRLELVFEIGSLEGDDAFGIIGDLAVSDDSLLAVADEPSCRILLFDFPSGELRSKVGGCGEGPGEFVQVGPVTFKADTLVVYDFRKRRLIRLDLDGNEIRSDIVFPDEAEAFVWLVDARPERTLLMPTWLPRRGREEMLFLSDDRNRTVRGLRDARISYTNQENASRSAVACLLRRSDAVAVANKWAVQAAILDGELEPRFEYADDIAWFGPWASSQQGGWTPGFFPPAVACGDTLALWRYRKNEFTWEGGDVVDRRVEKGILFAATASGELIHREVVADTTWPHVASMEPAAGLGDVFFFYQNNWGSYPTVRAYRLVRRVQPTP